MSVELGPKGLEIIKRLERLNQIFRESVVSFDIDGVEVDSGPSAIAELNLRLGTNYQVTDLTKYWGVVDLLRKNHPQIKDPRGYAIELWKLARVG